jgi:hypothetical protein
MEAANLSETLVIVYQSERRYSLEDLNLHRYCRDNFKYLTPLLLGADFFTVLSVSFCQCHFTSVPFIRHSYTTKAV